MPLNVPNVGAAKFLEAAVTNQNFTLKLFTNNVTPTETDTAATYTEASGSGYAAKTLTGTLTGGTWTVSGAADPAVASYPEQIFTFTGALGNVYGYFIVGATDGVLRLAELLPAAPFNVASNADQVKVTPQITGD